MVININNKSWTFPETTNWFAQNCNNLQIVTLRSTGWKPVKDSIGQLTSYSSSVLQGNENTIVTQLAKLKAYVNGIRLQASAYYKWAEEMQNARHRDREAMGGANCPRSDVKYREQKDAANAINEEAIAIIQQIDAASNSAESLLDIQDVGGSGYNAQLETAINDLYSVGEEAQKAQKRSQIAIVVVAVVLLAFIVYRIVKR